MKVGDFDVQVTTARTDGGWQATGVMPNGNRITSGPCTTEEAARNDIKQQATARLYPQRKYDVNRPFESMNNRKYPGISEVEEVVVMHQADQRLEAVSSDWVPPHQNFDDSDEELNLASRHPWNAWEYAQRRKLNHPKLEQAVKGSPFEHPYRQFFQAQPRPKASFYPSDGGMSGGGGGITSA